MNSKRSGSQATSSVELPEQQDRWSGYGDNTGILDLEKDLRPDQLRAFEIFSEFKDSFLEDISPDVTIAKWDRKAVLFEEGTYLDLGFYVVEGSVEFSLKGLEGGAKAATQPIFARDSSPSPRSTTMTPESSQSASGDTIALLATMAFDLGVGERVILKNGDVFGEIGALNGWPQSATARTASVCTLVQIRVPALRKLKRKSKVLRKKLDDAYRSRTLDRQLQTTPLLASCSNEVIGSLAGRAELLSLDPGETLSNEGEDADALYLVRSGFIKLTKHVEEREMVVSYASKGTTVGEVELMIEGIDHWQFSATSVGYSELVKFDHKEFLSVVSQFPEVEEQLWEFAVSAIKTTGYTKRNPDRSQLTEFSLAKGVVQGTSVLVIDLEVCTRCDDCVRGCASTHGGRPRFVREGEKYGGFLVARSCYHCEDPVCLVGCPTGAIARLNVGATVAINDGLCIGCGNCANNCTYDAIVMHDTETIWSQTAEPARLRGEERWVASKCDLCATSPEGPACVSSCPHGCAYRVSDVAEFDALIQAKRFQREAAVRQ